MPDDVSVEEIIKELAFKRMVDRGIQDSLNDRVISQEQLEKQIALICCSKNRGNYEITSCSPPC